METFISILRGINVSGQKKIEMAGLKTLYEDIGFKEVITYIQSGNVIFKAAKNVPDKTLAAQIEKKISGNYGFEVPVIVRTAAEMKGVLDSNPFLERENTDREKLHVTFLDNSPGRAELAAIEKFSYLPDEFIVSGREVYVYCPNGYGNTKLSNTFFESRLKVKATTRNWKTVNKLVELAGKQA